jgi:ribosomal protein S18 acetylase RimI-like enzyme
MSEVFIRQATVEDAEMLAELSAKTFWDAFHAHPANAPEDMSDYMKKAFNVQQIRKELENKKAFFLVAEVDGIPVGYAKLLLESREDPIKAEKPIELCRLYLTTEFIGKGVGQKLMDECFSIALQRGCDVMWLGVWEFNFRAQRFYEKQGFHRVGQHIFQLGADAQTDFLMQKELS